MTHSLKQLAIDVGNSRIKFVVLHTNLPVKDCKQLPLVEHAVSMPIDEPIPWDQLRNWFGNQPEEHCQSVVAGSNPRGIIKIVSDWPLTPLPSPVEVLNTADFPLEIDVDEPRKVGIDRLLNAVAANTLRNTDQGAIIVDTGTATTVDVVSTEGHFVGGSILPGFELSAKSLHDYTALLPLIPVADLRQAEPVVLGNHTINAIRSGLFWGQLGAIRELIHQFQNHSLFKTSSESPLILLTGGGSSLLASHLDDLVQFEPLLTLQGLAIVAQKISGIR
ncbi:type III pantothenate kinase [Gimesia algae]|uniref:Type III pantothenate kinase n=1 Tax=Gimesia algae TaxID=2527971 RepID=A0A517VEE1_9PLAN|nr:type III pantothenate kinase [Gimesia algae]QDT91382.1 Type III pantothenate kinase [Gimesia algae]